MTMTLKQHTENGYHVTLEFNKEGYLSVQVFPCFDDMCGNPICKTCYSFHEKKKAEATFRRYVKKYCKGE